MQISELRADVRKPLKSETKRKEYFDYGLKPDCRTYLNDPSGFFKYRFGLSGWVSFSPWPGSALLVAAETFSRQYDFFSQHPSSNAVRTDLVDYIQEKVSLSGLSSARSGRARGRSTAAVRRAPGDPVCRCRRGDRDAALWRATARRCGRECSKKAGPEESLQAQENDYKDYYTTGFFNTA